MTIGSTVGERYRISRVLGVGCAGTVYQATDTLLHRQVAVKILGREAPDILGEQLLRGARIAAALQDDHVVRIFDAGRLDDGRPFTVMEHLTGETLEARVEREGPLSPSTAVAIAVEICAALAVVHGHGFVHRDIKPDNLFLVRTLDGFTTKLLDFGTARATDDQGDFDRSPVGTPAYLAPEQVLTPHLVDPRSDLRAVGAVLFELLTGTLPFDGPTVDEILAQVVCLQPPTPGGLVDLDPALDAIVDRCLAREPEARFADVGELAMALAAHAPNRMVALRVPRTLADTRRHQPAAADLEEAPGDETPMIELQEIESTEELDDTPVVDAQPLPVELPLPLVRRKAPTSEDDDEPRPRAQRPSGVRPRLTVPYGTMLGDVLDPDDEPRLTVPYDLRRRA